MTAVVPQHRLRLLGGGEQSLRLRRPRRRSNRPLTSSSGIPWSSPTARGGSTSARTIDAYGVASGRSPAAASAITRTARRRRPPSVRETRRANSPARRFAARRSTAASRASLRRRPLRFTAARHAPTSANGLDNMALDSGAALAVERKVEHQRTDAPMRQGTVRPSSTSAPCWTTGREATRRPAGLVAWGHDPRSRESVFPAAEVQSSAPRPNAASASVAPSP